MTSDVLIEHRYPEGLAFLQQHGPDALVVLHDLLAHAQRRGDQFVVQASVREIADRLSFLSKDTVHRRLRQLRRAQVISTDSTRITGAFEPPIYVVNLTDTGISVTTVRPSRSQASRPAPDARQPA
ncbi:MAG: hypothetical protein ABR540_15280 [Acidimicrobiales bacterium]